MTVEFRVGVKNERPTGTALYVGKKVIIGDRKIYNVSYFTSSEPKVHILCACTSGESRGGPQGHRPLLVCTTVKKYTQLRDMVIVITGIIIALRSNS